MGLFELTTVVIVLTAVLSYLNARFVRLPTTIGVMVMSLGLSLLLLAVGEMTPGFRHFAVSLVGHIDFNQTLLHGMLAFLLFAAALHLNLNDLLRQWMPILLLSLPGTVLSMFLIGGLSWLAAHACGLGLPFGWCLVLGALISPTDPIAVVGVMRRVGAALSLETLLCGESLFNDGVGVVLFGVTLQTLGSGPHSAVHWVVIEVLVQSGGGIAVGLLAGVVINAMLRQVMDYKVELMLTLALAMGSYALAENVHVSGPIACVTAGLILGSLGRTTGMSDASREHIDIFWELMDEVLNAVLFVLIGLEVLSIVPTGRHLVAGLLCVPAALIARWLCVGGIIGTARMGATFEPGVVPILTWGGLRGGLSVAMALAIPESAHRPAIVVITYVIVVFSILVQGLTVGRVLRFFQRTTEPTPSDDEAALSVARAGEDSP